MAENTGRIKLSGMEFAPLGGRQPRGCGRFSQHSATYTTSGELRVEESHVEQADIVTAVDRRAARLWDTRNGGLRRQATACQPLTSRARGAGSRHKNRLSVCTA